MTKPKVRITYAIVAAALGLALSASLITPALAAQPHFIGTPTCSTSGSGTTTKTLTCTGKIAGLGNVSTATVFLRATATTQCTNPGGNLPPGQSAVTGTPQTFQVNNGQIVFTASLSASAGCPPPQTGSVTFTNVAVVVDSTVLPIAGTFDP
jgi:hypothetical protein